MAFSSRYIGEYENELYIDLKDASKVLWTTAELDRCVQRAVDDLSRHYPRELAYEHTINYTVTDEASTAPAAGTWLALTYKPIRPDSEVVTNSTGVTTYTKDTDYTMDYINGKYTIITGGGITAGASLLVSYNKSLLGVDLSAIITNMLRVTRVEAPGNIVPQQFTNFNIWDNFMYIGSQGQGKSQIELADKDHVVIYYEAPHTAPLTAAAPSYPAFLDEVVCIGGAAYAMLMKSIQCEHQAVTDIASMRTELDLTTAIHALIVTALGKVTTYVTDMDTALDAAIVQIALAATALAKVVTYLETHTTWNAQLMLEAITTTLHGDTITAAKHADAVLTQLSDALSVTEADLNAVYTEQKKFLLTAGGYDPIEVQTLLAAGDDYINKANLGSRVAELYNEYAQTGARSAEIAGQIAVSLVSLDHAEASRMSSIAQSMGAVASSLGAAAAAADALIANNRTYVEESTAWVAIARAFIDEGLARVNSGNSYIAEANGRFQMTQAFIGEAQTRTSQIDRYIAEAEHYRQAVEQDLTLSDRYRVEGQQRMADFTKILESRAQYRKRISSTPLSQPA